MKHSLLDEILGHKRGILRKKQSFYKALKDTVRPRRHPSLFKERIVKKGHIHLIAEIKKASPSKGLIRKDFDLGTIARIYVSSGASAISVLTEDKYFLGSPAYVTQVSSLVDVPILAKDFILSEGQIYEACSNGASAVLLIVAILNDAALHRLVKTAASLGLDVLVEVHNKQELKRALDCGAQIIGVNNRDLKTFMVDMRTCRRIVPSIPKGKVIVAESGYQHHDEIVQLQAMGVHAVLIGETFMQAKDIGVKIKQIISGDGDKN